MVRGSWLLASLRLVNMDKFHTLWHYGTYFGAAGLGALIADCWISERSAISMTSQCFT